MNAWPEPWKHVYWRNRVGSFVHDGITLRGFRMRSLPRYMTIPIPNPAEHPGSFDFGTYLNIVSSVTSWRAAHVRPTACMRMWQFDAM
jgi:hypothetical protein